MSRTFDLPKQEGTSHGATPNSHGPSPNMYRSPHSDSPVSISRKDSSLTSIKVGNGTPSSTSDLPSTIEPSIKQEMSRPSNSRKASQRVPVRTPTLFLDERDRYDEATSKFAVIEDCIYSNKHLGQTEPALECDCGEEWDAKTATNLACDHDSDCINRATKMECIDDCSCGLNCQNQRFQRKEWANVTVFKTEKKGYGLRADQNLRADDFIFEYVGEVITEPQFRRRMIQYDDEGIKHFYFMSLSKGEFIDATKKGNLGRFCNHSCNPNCYVDKWVVGDKLRMGIFAEKDIQIGEELVFNYNVDRYGAEPQPCYCGEPNCTGFLGGKTQTDSGPKLSNATIEALGLDDFDGWEFDAPIRPKKARKTGENDDEYVSDAKQKNLEEDGVTKVMATLMQCKEKWIAVKLLTRIQRASDERVMHRIVRMHGYRILKSALSKFLEDANVCLQVLDVLFKLPRITRNKIQDSRIEEVVEKLKESDDERVVNQSGEILEIWSQLEVAYRIPKVKRDPNAMLMGRGDRHMDRRDIRARSRSPKSPVAPTGPKSQIPQRKPPTGPMAGSGGLNRQGPPRPPRSFNALPIGWYSAMSEGKIYYYNAQGQRTWTRPTEPAIQVEPEPIKKDKEMSHEQRLALILEKVKSVPKESPTTPSSTQAKDEKKEDRWRNYSEEKQRKIYENTLHPHIMSVVEKYKRLLPREDLKRFGKEIAKKLVNSDYKHNRVSDPTQISSNQAKSVKKFVKEYFDKAVVKHREHEKRKKEREAAKLAADLNGGDRDLTMGMISPIRPQDQDEAKHESIEDEVKLTDDEGSDVEDEAVNGKKRKDVDEDEEASSKRAKTEGIEDTMMDTPPPPPPPPPPTDEGVVNGNGHLESVNS